jgi:hypothetical protein
VQLLATVAQLENTVGTRGERGVVRRHHSGDPALVHQIGDEIHHDLRVLAVQLSGGLVGEEQARIRHERPRDAHPLLLPAGQLLRELVRVIRETDRAEGLTHPLVAAGRGTDGGPAGRLGDDVGLVG